MCCYSARAKESEYSSCLFNGGLWIVHQEEWEWYMQLSISHLWELMGWAGKKVEMISHRILCGDEK